MRPGIKKLNFKQPKDKSKRKKSREYQLSAMKYLTSTFYRLSGSCMMGAANDPTTVVDPTLKVKGIDGVRVINASVMPEITSRNMNAPTIMIGEKGADLIKKT